MKSKDPHPRRRMERQRQRFLHNLAQTVELEQTHERSSVVVRQDIRWPFVSILRVSISLHCRVICRNRRILLGFEVVGEVDRVECPCRGLVAADFSETRPGHDLLIDAFEAS